jgi:hypothetical protein
VVRCEPANFLETPRFSGVRTFMRLPNVQGLENADATIAGTYAPSRECEVRAGLKSREMLMLVRGVPSRGLVGWTSSKWLIP